MGSNDHMLNGLQFQYHVNADKGKHELTTFFTGRPDFELGRMDWHTGDKGPAGEISYIHTANEFRRKGVATSMYEHAKQLDPGVKHSENRTKLGDKWAKSTGDPVPKLWSQRLFGE